MHNKALMNWPNVAGQIKMSNLDTTVFILLLNILYNIKRFVYPLCPVSTMSNTKWTTMSDILYFFTTLLPINLLMWLGLLLSDVLSSTCTSHFLGFWGNLMLHVLDATSCKYIFGWLWHGTEKNDLIADNILSLAYTSLWLKILILLTFKVRKSGCQHLSSLWRQKGLYLFIKGTMRNSSWQVYYWIYRYVYMCIYSVTRSLSHTHPFHSLTHVSTQAMHLNSCSHPHTYNVLYGKMTDTYMDKILLTLT